MRTLRLLTIALLMITLAAIGCSGEQGSSGQSESTAEVESGVFVGKVVETMDVNSYTYVLVEGDGESVWAAGPLTPVSVGDEVAIDTGMFMADFHSETLDRTFDKLYFVTEIVPPGARSAGSAPGGMNPHGMGGSAKNTEDSAGHGAPKVAKDGDFSGIETPEGGMTVADVWARRNELVGQEVIVRGRVAKYNGGIMGRNWIHLQDGSGSEVDGTHDLLVTSDTKSAAGNIITIRGTVVLDQDFGSGYQYALLVEKATIE